MSVSFNISISSLSSFKFMMTPFSRCSSDGDRGLLLDPLDKGPRTRVYLDHIAFVQVEGDLDDGPGFQRRRLRSARGRVAPHAWIGFRDCELYEHRDIDINGLSLMIEDLDLHVLFEIIDAVAQLLLAHGYLLVAGRVHEYAVLVRCIKVLHGLLFQLRHVDLFTRSEGLIGYVARFEALKLGPHERPALARLYVLKLHDHVRFTVNLDL